MYNHDMFSAEKLVAHTDEEYGFDTVWFTETALDHVIFHVSADSDARIALSDAMQNNQQGYEVVFGAQDNTVSYIRYLGVNQTVALTETSGILQGPAFWIRFDNGHIEAGTGVDVGAHSLLDWQDPETPTQVKAIGFSTGFSHKGSWQVNEFRGEVTD